MLMHHFIHTHNEMGMTIIFILSLLYSICYAVAMFELENKKKTSKREFREWLMEQDGIKCSRCGCDINTLPGKDGYIAYNSNGKDHRIACILCSQCIDYVQTTFNCKMDAESSGDTLSHVLTWDYQTTHNEESEAQN
jgi:hypothetical protein